MTTLSSGYTSKCCTLTWERKKTAMYEQIVTVGLRTRKKRWLHHYWHLQSAKNSLQKSVWSFWVLSKLLQSHFNRFCSHRAQPGAGPGLSSDQMASAHPDCPVVRLHEELICPMTALACTLQSLLSPRQSKHLKSKQLVLCCHPSNMASSGAVPVLHKIPN